MKVVWHSTLGAMRTIHPDTVVVEVAVAYVDERLEEDAADADVAADSNPMRFQPKTIYMDRTKVTMMMLSFWLIT
jgi:hypothetical protein